MRQPIENKQPAHLNAIEALIFGSRWLQLPLYLGLIIAQMVYVYKFGVELVHLVTSSPGLTEVQVMLIVLSLVDVVMVANLLIMVIVGGYETFVSRLYIDDHPDKPDWFSHVDAGMLKIKLAVSLISISSIHLLKTFINAENIPNDKIVFQIAIHMAFILSAIALAYTEKLSKLQKQ